MAPAERMALTPLPPSSRAWGSLFPWRQGQCFQGPACLPQVWGQGSGEEQNQLGPLTQERGLEASLQRTRCSLTARIS